MTFLHCSGGVDVTGLESVNLILIIFDLFMIQACFITIMKKGGVVVT